MYKTISEKQAFGATWWLYPEYKDFRRVIHDGAIRTDKTHGCSISFKEWAIDLVVNNYEHNRPKGYATFLFVGTTRENIKENVIDEVCDDLETTGYTRCNRMAELKKGSKYKFYIHEMISTLFVRHESHIIKFRYLGANNKLAVKRIQGKTLHGAMIDEGALIDLVIHETIEQRCVSFDSDYKIFFTTNPEGGEDHWFYQHYIKGKMYSKVNGRLIKENLVISYCLLDNPQFTQEHVDRAEQQYTKSMFMRKILGKWIKGIGSIYTKFDKDKHVKPLKWIMENNRFGKFTIGGDIGATDATTFTFTGITQRYDKVCKMKHYYHKNNEESEKDIIEYVDDFFEFAKDCFDLFKRPIEVYIDSADKQFRQLVVRGKIRRGYNWLITGSNAAVNKQKENIKASSAIKERIDFDNVLFGTNSIEISDGDDCKPLVNAYLEATYDDKGNRLDNGTSNIDSLDSSEYSTKRYIRKIMEVLSIRKKVL